MFGNLYRANAIDFSSNATKQRDSSLSQAFEFNRRDATGNVASWHNIWIRLQQEARKLYSIPIARALLDKAFRVSGLRLRYCFSADTRDCSLYLTKTHLLLFVYPGLVCVDPLPTQCFISNVMSSLVLLLLLF